MTYVTPANLRAATLAEFAYGFDLTTTEVPSTGSDALLTATIVRMSQRFDDYTNDHYESDGETGWALESMGTDKLFIPRRTNALYHLYTVDADGNETLQDDEAWRFTSSLDPNGQKRVREFDTIEIIPLGPGLEGTYSPWCFDKGWTVLVDADFGWVVCPGDIKLAVTMMVYHHYKPQADVLGSAVEWTDQSARYQVGPGKTGLPRVDKIIDEYRRDGGPGVA